MMDNKMDLGFPEGHLDGKKEWTSYLFLSSSA